MNEKCWFIHGWRTGNAIMGFLKYHSEGSPGWVKFDWAKAAGKVVGFYHSHPSGFTSPSGRDDRTMRAWVISEGKPMVCGIFCDGKYLTYLYERRKDGIYCYEIRALLKGNLFWARPLDQSVYPRKV